MNGADPGRRSAVAEGRAQLWGGFLEPDPARAPCYHGANSPGCAGAAADPDRLFRCPYAV